MTLTTKQAAELLEVSKARVLQLLAAGRFAATLVNGRWAIDRASLEKCAVDRDAELTRRFCKSDG